MHRDKTTNQSQYSERTTKRVCFNPKLFSDHTEIEDIGSTANIDQKRSSFRLLSALVHRTKFKSKFDPKARILSSPGNLDFNASNSTMGSHSSEAIGISVENASGINVQEANGKSLDISDSEHSVASAKVKRRFFSKFLKRNSMPDESKKKVKHVPIIEGDLKDQRRTVSEIKLKLEKEKLDENPMPSPTCYIQTVKPALSTSLMHGLVVVQNLATRLSQSEGHLLQIFMKYTTDSSFQKELVDNLCLHSQLHLETERMNNVLSMEMWLKQIEISKMQENALQEALDSVVGHNRQLQCEYENLFCTYEKLLNKFKHFNGNNAIDPDTQIQEIIKHNMKLTQKMQLLFKQIEQFEFELTNLRNENEDLETKLSHSMLKYQDLEGFFHQCKIDYELEMAKLNYQLKNKEKTVSKVIDACEEVKADLVNLEIQMKPFDLITDHHKLKVSEESLYDFIDFTRIALKKLMKELLIVQQQITVKENEIQMLSETNARLQESLKRSTTELDGFAKQIDESDKLLAEHRYKCLEADMKMKEEKLERIKIDYEIERRNLLQKIQEYERSYNDKFATMEQSNIHYNAMISENNALRKQVDNLNKILQNAESLDVFKELNDSKEKISKLDLQCNQLKEEKQAMHNQLEYLKGDHKHLSEYQNASFQQVQKLQSEIDGLLTENRQLQQKLETERQTVITLQTERKKYLEEKAVIKEFFRHMKSEINRLQKLEETVTDISKEANKLAMVAEYNKELGKKLKEELDEKDKTILKLRSSVEKLNDIQMQGTKDKLALCQELSELCHVKDKLNSELSWEVQRSSALDDANNEILQQYEEFHKKEKSILKDLIKDLKCVIKQRNSLITEKDCLVQESEALKNSVTKYNEQQKVLEENQQRLTDQSKIIDELRSKNEEQKKKIHALLAERRNNEERMREMDEEQEDYKQKIFKLEEKLVEELHNYNENILEMEKIIFELKKEKERMEDTVKYLQNTTQKLHNDLNISRCKEKEISNAFELCLADKLALEERNYTYQREIEKLSTEKSKLVNEMNQINLVCERILSDFENNISSSLKKEEIFKAELLQSKNALITVCNENDNLIKELLSIKDDFETINRNFNNLKEQEKLWMDLVESLENKKENFKYLLNQKEKLEYDYKSLNEVYIHNKENLKKLKEKNESLQTQINSLMEQTLADKLKYEKDIKDIINKNEELLKTKDREIDQLKSNVDDLNRKLENEITSYTALSDIHKEVSTKFIKSIKDMVDEKNTRHEIENKLNNAVFEIQKLQSEKNELEQKINVLSKKLEEKESVLNLSLKDFENSQTMLTELQQKHNDILNHCTALQDQISQVDINNSESEEVKFLQAENEKMKKDLDEYHNIKMSLQKDIAEQQQEITRLKFNLSEVTLRLHESQRKLETEKNFCEQLKSVQKIVLDGILKLKNDGVVGREHCDSLINHIKHDYYESDNDDFDDTKNLQLSDKE